MARRGLMERFHISRCPVRHSDPPSRHAGRICLASSIYRSASLALAKPIFVDKNSNRSTMDHRSTNCCRSQRKTNLLTRSFANFFLSFVRDIFCVDIVIRKYILFVEKLSVNRYFVKRVRTTSGRPLSPLSSVATRRTV